jgi:hypothetical protein
MDLDSAKIADLRVKHLEMLQAVISRIAGQGATLKNYCITLLALFPVTIFALLDAQYLRMERRFRVLFDRVRLENWGTVPSFEISSKSAPNVSYWDALRSWSIFIFYAPLALAVVIVVLIARCAYG